MYNHRPTSTSLAISLNSKQRLRKKVSFDLNYRSFFVTNPKPFIARTLCCIACLLSFSMTANSQVVPSVVQRDPLEDFLIKNRLTRLLLTHREVQAEMGENDRDPALEKLQRSYATELFRSSNDDPWSKIILEKAKFSLAANTNRTNRQSERLRLAVSHREVELLQHDYLIGKNLAATDVDRIIEEINLIQRGVKQQVDNLDRLTELKQTEIGDQSHLNQLRKQLGHGEYLLGWSYFLKSAASDHQSKPVLRDAESYFRSHLKLDPHANLTKFRPDQFGPPSRFQSMATVGLASVMHSLGSQKQADHCFDIAHESARSGLNEERDVQSINRWKFAIFFNGGNRTLAAQVLDERPQLLRDKTLIGLILSQSRTEDPLVEKAVTQLTLDFDSDRLLKALDGFPNTFSQNDILGPWLRGYLALDDFQKNGETTSLKRATRELSAAADKLDPQIPDQIRGHCQFLLGSCLHLSKRYTDAASEFSKAAKRLQQSENSRDGDRDLAAESAYRALQSVRLIPGDQGVREKNIVKWLNTFFPVSPFTRLANFDADSNRRNGLSDQEAVAYLSRLRENEPSALVRSAASVELAKRHSLSPTLQLATFGNFVKTIHADDRVSDDAKIQTNYYYVSKLLAQPSPQGFAEEVEEVLGNVKRMLEGTSTPGLKKTEAAKFLYFQSLALSTLQPKNHIAAHRFFREIERLDDSSPWTSAATIEIAKVFENAENTMNSNDQAFRGKMIDVYKFLFNRSNSTQSANREVVSHKLARLYLAEDRLLEAEKLLQNSKPDPHWLPLHADLAKKKNDLHRCASLWQQLEKQSLAGTDIWLDARLNRLSVLHQFDKPTAVELLDRTIALNPDMHPTYATQFQQLANRWGIR